MSSLFGLLDLGAAALQAHNAGVAVASNNVANANTDGYSRQRVDLQSQLAAQLVGGVRAGGVERLSSDLLAARIRSNTSSVSVAEAFASALLDLEARMTSGGDLGQLAANFFAGLSEVSSAPSDQNLRRAAVEAARSLASGMQQAAQAAADARGEANQRIREHLKEANRLMRDIAKANVAVANTGDAVMRDRRDVAAQELAELVGGAARIDADGHMRVTMAGGEVLVDGPKAVQLSSTPDPSLGNMDRIELTDGQHRRDVTALIDGGSVGGELRARDRAIPAAQAQLDQLAFDMATQINQVHRQNAGTDGVTGRDLFVTPTQVDGAAAAMAVDPALLADAALLATAAPGAGPGDNQGARALIALRDQPLAGGGQRTFTDAAIDIVTDVGRGAAEATVDRDFFAAQGDHLAGLRDAASGVSLQEEMSNLSQFQHASEAQVRFLSTVDELLGNIIQGL